MLVAIAIPVFTAQLEKSRDAVSVSNIRAAYAEAASTVLTANGKAITMGNATTAKAADGKQTVTVSGVVLKGQVEGWSDMDTELSFTKTGMTATAGGTPGTVTATFEFTLATGAAELKTLG